MYEFGIETQAGEEARGQLPQVIYTGWVAGKAVDIYHLAQDVQIGGQVFFQVRLVCADMHF